MAAPCVHYILGQSIVTRLLQTEESKWGCWQVGLLQSRGHPKATHVYMAFGVPATQKRGIFNSLIVGCGRLTACCDALSPATQRSCDAMRCQMPAMLCGPNVSKGPSVSACFQHIGPSVSGKGVVVALFRLLWGIPLLSARAVFHTYLTVHVAVQKHCSPSMRDALTYLQTTRPAGGSCRFKFCTSSCHAPWTARTVLITRTSWVPPNPAVDPGSLKTLL